MVSHDVVLDSEPRSRVLCRMHAPGAGLYASDDERGRDEVGLVHPRHAWWVTHPRTHETSPHNSHITFASSFSFITLSPLSRSLAHNIHCHPTRPLTLTLALVSRAQHSLPRTPSNMPKANSKKRARRQNPSPPHAEATSHASHPISLPLDVLRQITCKDLYCIATPTLYADVHLNSDEQVERLLDSLADEAVGKALRTRGRRTRSGSLGSAQSAAIARLELLQSTTRITFDFIPHHTTCDQLRVTADKLGRSSLCANVSNMLFASPTAEELHDLRHSFPLVFGNEPFTIDCLRDIARLPRPAHVCFRYTQVPGDCTCMATLVNIFIFAEIPLQKVSLHAKGIDLRTHLISNSHQKLDFQVFLADKTRRSSLARHLSDFALRNGPCEACDPAIAIKVVTPECDTDNLMEEIQRSLDDWIGPESGGWSFDLITRSATIPCEVCGGRSSLDTSSAELTGNL
jgi:hypothetical protein